MATLEIQPDERLLTGTGDNEDAAVLRFPAGKALVQTVDFLTPVVNDPFRFGRIAAANALSDVYAMGGEPWSVMNIVCFPIKTLDRDILAQALRGGYEAIMEAGAVLAGGHSVEDDEFKYGLSVSGVIDPGHRATNRGLRAGDDLLLTKPIGTGVLSTAIKGRWENSEKMEDEVFRWAGRLNRFGGEAIQKFKLLGATDVTGFGLGGHVLEMAQASHVRVELWPNAVPLLPQVEALAGIGMLPAGSFANRSYCASQVGVHRAVDSVLADLVFDAQTSGGLVLSVPAEKREAVQEFLISHGDLAAHVGHVLPADAPVDAVLNLKNR
ncbi:selenophosphate synthase [Desulfobaculum bizertense DSM 18034]|uniref:Selenophosphate synthase n=1 Tax=Desulfobaculum bizertense DSM 18034 TaxID=1121442 RepID=A0A1T4WFX5_9BACT|nr:selenophosphate synthase [Desulfobaculum bizertense DSM 18034]